MSILVKKIAPCRIWGFLVDQPLTRTVNGGLKFFLFNSNFRQNYFGRTDVIT